MLIKYSLLSLKHTNISETDKSGYKTLLQAESKSQLTRHEPKKFVKPRQIEMNGMIKTPKLVKMEDWYDKKALLGAEEENILKIFFRRKNAEE